MNGGSNTDADAIMVDYQRRLSQSGPHKYNNKIIAGSSSRFREVPWALKTGGPVKSPNLEAVAYKPCSHA